MNISRAETEDEIAAIDHVADSRCNQFKPRLISDAAMTVRNDLIDDRLAADSRDAALRSPDKHRS